MQHRRIHGISPVTTLTIVLALMTSAPVFAVTCNWTNPAGGLWSTVTNWDCGKAPGAGDTANITLVSLVPYTVATDITVSVTNLTVGPGTAAPAITLSIAGNPVTVTGSGSVAQNGIVSISAVSLIVPSGATLTIQNGGLVRTSGSGRLQIGGSTVVNGELRLDADGVNGNPQGTPGGTLTITPTGLLNLSGTGNGIFIADVNVTNNGTIDYTGAGPGQFGLINNNTVTNNASFNVGDRSWFGGFGTGRIVNSASGVYRKTVGTGAHAIIYPFSNSGTLDIQTGSVLIAGASATGTNTGTIRIAPTSTLDISGGVSTFNYTFGAGTTFPDVGKVRLRDVNYVTLTIAADVSMPNLVLGFDGSSALNAVITGPGALTVTKTLDWFSGTMSGSGTTVIPAGATMNLTGAAVSGMAISGRTINNSGTAILSANAATSVQGTNGIFNNLAGAVFDAQTDADFLGTGTFTNAGLLKKSAGAARTSFGNWLLSNSGTVQVLSGELGPNGFNGPGYVQTAGSLVLNGGNFTTGGNNADIRSGTVSGNGTITAGTVLNSGVIGPGLSAGMLTISGNYTQTTNGTLAIEIGGTTAGTQYDQLNVTGTATLGGTLALSLINAFSPVPGNTFTVMTYASHGTSNFSVITGVSIGGGKSFLVATNATNVVVTTTNLPSGDANGDGQVTVADVFYLINFLFTGGPAPIGPADANGDGQVTVTDVFYLINYLFANGPAPR